MGELIFLHIGQCGCRIGVKFWELAINETLHKDSNNDSEENKQILYSKNEDKLTPRAIFIDLDKYEVNKAYNSLIPKNTQIEIHQKSFISGTDDGHNNYGFSYYKNSSEASINAIRREVENCSHVGAFIITHSMSGGTGSGFGSAILGKLSHEFPKIPKICFEVVPDVSTDPAMTPYNYLGAMQANAVCSPSVHSDINIMFDNQSLYNNWSKNTNNPAPTLNDINQLISTVIDSTIFPMRYSYSTNSIMDMVMNLVPNPELNFIIPSFGTYSHTHSIYKHKSAGDLAEESFNPSNYLLNTENKMGKLLTSSLQYQGAIPLPEIYECISHIKDNIKLDFSPHIQTGIKLGIAPNSHIFPEEWDMDTNGQRSVCMLGNMTGVNNYFENVGKWFDWLYCKRAFVHHFVSEGMEEGEIIMSRHHLDDIIYIYNEFAKSI